MFNNEYSCWLKSYFISYPDMFLWHFMNVFITNNVFREKKVIRIWLICHLNIPLEVKSRCIRPPQSQSGTNNFLKTSVCADGSQHHWDFFFVWTFKFFLLLSGFFFSSLKVLFLDFHQEKLSFNTDIEMSYCMQLPLLKKPTKF